jgi:hypothetical protein
MVLVKTGEKWYGYSGQRTEEYGTEVMSVGPRHEVEDKATEVGEGNRDSRVEV